MKKAVLLDRDGVINKAIIKNGLPTSPNSLDELEILPGVKESILRLKKLNFICIVVTNQPDVPRRKINKNTVIKINNFLKKKLNQMIFLFVIMMTKITVIAANLSQVYYCRLEKNGIQTSKKVL